jgi:hypothetical protein
VVSLGGHYRGSASVKQSNFGISPIRIGVEPLKLKTKPKSNLISFRQMLNDCFSTPLQFVLRSS